MRTKLIVLSVAFLLLACAVISQTPVAIGQFVVVNANADPPIALTNTAIKATRLTLLGLKGNRSTNTSMVYVGYISNNNSQIIGILPGEPVSLLCEPGKAFVLSSIWLDVETAGDGVAVTYE